jgi:hypothetical protein
LMTLLRRGTVQPPPNLPLYKGEEKLNQQPQPTAINAHWKSALI